MALSLAVAKGHIIKEKSRLRLLGIYASDRRRASPHGGPRKLGMLSPTDNIAGASAGSEEWDQTSK